MLQVIQALFFKVHRVFKIKSRGFAEAVAFVILMPLLLVFMLIGPYLAIIGHARNAVDHAANNAARMCAVRGECSGSTATQVLASYGFNKNKTAVFCSYEVPYSSCIVKYNLTIPGGTFIQLLSKGMSNQFVISATAYYKTEQ